MMTLHSSHELWELAKERSQSRLHETERSRRIKRALADNIFVTDTGEQPARVRILPTAQPTG